MKNMMFCLILLVYSLSYFYFPKKSIRCFVNHYDMEMNRTDTVLLLRFSSNSLISQPFIPIGEVDDATICETKF